MKTDRVAGLLLGVAVGILLLGPAVARAGSCGDGILAPNEECDGGPVGLYLDGDPDTGACTTGSRCYFKYTCCKFNCQYVGTPGITCNDGNNCSGPDTCDQIGKCNGGPNVANGTPCDDGLFCTGVEECLNGKCLSSSGNPCPETACNRCQESTDSCFDPAGVSCSDGSVCISGGTCDGAGTCNGGVFNSGPCDDGVYCNGTDTCGGGACSVHSGDPCPGGDGDGNCQESCNEGTDACTAADPDGTACTDGLYCNGASDECQSGSCTGTGLTACDDGNSCTADFCNETTDACSTTTAADGVSCSDGNPCTIGDTCAAGVCSGPGTTMADLCPWTVLIREQAKTDLIKTNFRAEIDGDLCGGTIKLSEQTRIGSDLVSAETTGTGQLRLSPTAIVMEDILSGGAGAKAYPGSGLLPYLASPSQTLAPGTVQAKSDASGTWGLDGTDPLVADCNAGRTGYAAATGSLDTLAANATEPGFKLGVGATKTITATVPGGVNVVDITGSIKAATDSVIELDSGGSADTVMVLRVSGKLMLLLRSSIQLSGGLLPQNVLIYVKGSKCLLSDLTLGAGTLLCSPGRIKTGRSVAWVGALQSDGKMMKIGDRTSVHYTPFSGF